MKILCALPWATLLLIFACLVATVDHLALAQSTPYDPPTCADDGVTCTCPWKYTPGPTSRVHYTLAYDCDCIDGKDCICAQAGTCHCNGAKSCQCGGNTCYCGTSANCSGTGIMFCAAGAEVGDLNCQYKYDPGDPLTQPKPNPQINPYCFDGNVGQPNGTFTFPTCGGNVSVHFDDPNAKIPFSCASQYWCKNSTSASITNHPELVIAPVMAGVFLIGVLIGACILIPGCMTARRVVLSPPNPERNLKAYDNFVSSDAAYLNLIWAAIFLAVAIILFVNPKTYPYGYIPLFVSLLIGFTVGRISVGLRPSKNEFTITSYYCLCIPCLRYRDSLDNMSDATIIWKMVDRGAYRMKRRGDLLFNAYRKTGQPEKFVVNLGRWWQLCSCFTIESDFRRIGMAIVQYNQTPEQRADPSKAPAEPNGVHAYDPNFRTGTAADYQANTLRSGQATLEQMGVHIPQLRPLSHHHHPGAGGHTTVVIYQTNGPITPGTIPPPMNNGDAGYAPPPVAGYAPPPSAGAPLSGGDALPPAYSPDPVMNEKPVTTAKFCNQCGAPQTPDSRFCNQCGHHNPA